MRQLILVPCLAPVLAVLILSAINPGRSISIQILIWRSPQLPLGVWTALAASAGASFGAAGSILLVPSGQRLRRTLHQRVDSEPDTDFSVSKQPDPILLERDVRDPAPTVAVPFRIVQQPGSGSTRRPSQSDASSSDQPQQQEVQTDDWGHDIDRDW